MCGLSAQPPRPHSAPPLTAVRARRHRHRRRRRRRPCALLACRHGSVLEHKISPLFVFLYGLTFFFANFGPNMSTFVIPAEAFPTRARATCHGISAASGKAGAAIGSAVFPIILNAYASQEEGVATVLYLCAALSAVGLAWT